MINEPLISIICPVFNGQKYLAKSIESCIGQDYKNWELILVDDCSKDDTFSICKEYAQKDKRIKVFQNEKNLKLPASLNVGFSHASGEFYTWTSDDNFYLPNALSSMLKTLQEKKVDIVCSDFLMIDEFDNIISYYELLDFENVLYANVGGACFLYKAEVSKKLNGYDVNLFLVEDYDFWMRAYLAGFCAYHIKYALYFYRQHSVSLSGQNVKNVLERTYWRFLLNVKYLDRFNRDCQKKYWRYLISNMKKSANIKELSKFVRRNFFKIVKCGSALSFFIAFVKKYIRSKMGCEKNYFKSI
ncbi:MAG: glycosyltransferase [Elusimicrobiota bacterium]|jgi:glycosyltransferase involved in cell wall biosynthesis|nr:glycosyltransferase [Elusimicrobiota bacterium]